MENKIIDDKAIYNIFCRGSISNEVTATGEQLKQMYNNDYWKNAEVNIKTFKKELNKIMVAAMKTIKIKWHTISIEFIAKSSDNPEIKKCYGIYRRTNNARIRKKQLTRICKIYNRKERIWEEVKR